MIFHSQEMGEGIQGKEGSVINELLPDFQERERERAPEEEETWFGKQPHPCAHTVYKHGHIQIIVIETCIYYSNKLLLLSFLIFF